jgi:sortase A
VVTGLVLLWGALGVVGYRLGWTVHFHRGESALLQRASGRATPACGASSTPPVPPAPRDGQLMGVLEIPVLHVTAPVAQGTDNAVLDAAVGHAPSTPLPGTAGTAVLLAHDVSYFSGIAALRPGDVVHYTWACSTVSFRVTGHDVVAAGAAVPVHAGNGIVLDTCWPTDALWYTPDRYLVTAVQVGAAPALSSSSTTPHWPTAYRSPAPPALAAQGLDLPHNETPMGTLQLVGTPDRGWAQSPGPLAVEDAALATYFGGLRAAGERHPEYWTAIAPDVPMPAALAGSRVVAYDAPLDVRISARGADVTTVELDTTVTLAGGSAPGRHSVSVIEAVRGLDLVITSWEVHDG